MSVARRRALQAFRDSARARFTRVGRAPRAALSIKAAREIRFALAASAVFIACAVLAAALFLPLLGVFCVYDAGGGGSPLLPDKPGLAALPSLIALARGHETDFVISYTHSVNKGRVRDYCVLLADGSVLVTKTRFVSYGAGMSEPEGDEVFVVADDYLELSNLNLKIPRLFLRVGLVANHEIECGGRTFSLSDFFKPQTAVFIGRRNITLFDYIRSNRINAKE